MNLELDSQKLPWWNRPLFGKVSLTERLIGVINSKSVPELALSLHDTEIKQLEKIAPTIRMLDNDNYNEKFLFYIQTKYQIENNLDEYKGLYIFVQILSFVIHHLNDFRLIQRIELDYRGKTQLDLYNFIEQQLNINSDISSFQKLVNTEIDRVISIIINEPTKEALISYKEALNKIIEENIGLKFLILVKKYRLNNYDIFNVFIKVLRRAKKRDLQNLQELMPIVEANYTELAKIGKLIGIPPQINQPITFCKITQYLALNRKYNHLNYRFEQLVQNLLKWHKYYQTVLEVRKEYPRHKYKLPESLTKEIPGENIYFKYADYLHKENY